jgi:3-phosphoglycerate kinase
MMTPLRQADLKGKTVFYRPDYNVPLQDGVIQDTYRITATKPTLDYLIEQGCKIVIGAHLGRPEGQVNPEFDLRPVAEELATMYSTHTVRYAHEFFAPEVIQSIADMQAGDILLLPNLRFNPGEENNDVEFAKGLAQLADVYVNDAFACDHRAHASIVGIPAHIPGFAGFLLQDELDHLGGLLTNPDRPFVVIMGGAKVSDKIEVIRNLGKVADKLLIGGAMANTFLLAKGEPIGASKAEPDKKELAETLTQELGDKLVFPVDYVKEGEGEGFKYMDLGRETIALFSQQLKDAKTIFWNGSLGYVENPAYATATEAMAQFIAGLTGVKSVVAGGDTVETITKLNLHDKYAFVSTGGGAALEFLAGDELPGVKALEKKEEAAKE